MNSCSGNSPRRMNNRGYSSRSWYLRSFGWLSLKTYNTPHFQYSQRRLGAIPDIFNKLSLDYSYDIWHSYFCYLYTLTAYLRPYIQEHVNMSKKLCAAVFVRFNTFIRLCRAKLCSSKRARIQPCPHANGSAFPYPHARALC